MQSTSSVEKRGRDDAGEYTPSAAGPDCKRQKSGDSAEAELLLPKSLGNESPNSADLLNTSGESTCHTATHAGGDASSASSSAGGADWLSQLIIRWRALVLFVFVPLLVELLII